MSSSDPAAAPSFRPYALAAPLATERLLLRPFTLGDVDAVHDLHSRQDVVRYLYSDTLSRAEAHQRVEQKLGHVAIAGEGDGLGLAVVVAATREVVGDVALFLRSAAHACGEIGFVIHPGHHGRGYATEAARELLRVAFDEIGLHRVIGRIEARNAASGRVLERIGMRQEAHLIENEWVKGNWDSEIDYAILAREWREQHPG